MTTKGTDNRFRYLNIVKDVDPATPPSGDARLFVDSADLTLKWIDDDGTVYPLGAGGGSDLDTILAASSGQDIADALTGAAAPDAGNVFATMADVSGGASLTSAFNQLGSDVTMTTAGTWYTGATVTVGAGTWLLIAVLSFQASNKTVTARLHDGTNSLASAVDFCVSGGDLSLPLVAIKTVAGSTTFNAQATPQSNGGTLIAASGFNGVGNNACTLAALKVA